MLLWEDAGFPNRKDHAEISGTFKELSQMAFIVPTQIVSLPERHSQMSKDEGSTQFSSGDEYFDPIKLKPVIFDLSIITPVSLNVRALLC